jgi:hypothetical protein
VDARGVSIGLSPLFEKPPSFANAIVQNIGGGNTMVFNEAARQLIAQTVKDAQVVSHDWWAYLLVSACGGAVPTILSTQTGNWEDRYGFRANKLALVHCGSLHAHGKDHKSWNRNPNRCHKNQVVERGRSSSCTALKKKI